MQKSQLLVLLKRLFIFRFKFSKWLTEIQAAAYMLLLDERVQSGIWWASFMCGSFCVEHHYLEAFVPEQWCLDWRMSKWNGACTNLILFPLSLQPLHSVQLCTDGIEFLLERFQVASWILLENVVYVPRTSMLLPRATILQDFKNHCLRFLYPSMPC